MLTAQYIPASDSPRPGQTDEQEQRRHQKRTQRELPAQDQERTDKKRRGEDIREQCKRA